MYNPGRGTEQAEVGVSAIHETNRRPPNQRAFLSRGFASVLFPTSPLGG
uniref:Diguanylate phosphodiesterase n=1 Tax=Heterorhabditis bacteriophora TaxID=37862 RepID=A0A1I7WM16_HETBA